MAHTNNKLNAVNQKLGLPLAEAFEKDLKARIAKDNTVTISMIDLDNFMRVNQQFGESEGDRVLIQTGEFLRASLPVGSSLYRFGGDQFAFVFPEKMEREEAFLIMEALRKAFSILLPDGSPVTLSAGIAAFPEDGNTYSEIVRKADGAMYRGKLVGHNRVCLAREEKMITKTSHYTADQLKRLTKVSKAEGVGEAVLLREALDTLLRKYDA